MKIEVKKKIDVIFDCREGSRRPKVISESKRNRNFEKKLLEHCEKILELSGLHAVGGKNPAVDETFRQKISAISGTACGYLGNHHSFVDLRNAERRA